MKKYLLLWMTFFLFLPVGVSAKTVLQREQVSDGKISLSLTSEETGYVTAFQIQFYIEGNVQAESFEWSSNIPKTYTRKIIYDNEKQTVQIIVATGNDTNLMNEEGRLEIGNLQFVLNNTKNPKYYNVTFDEKAEVPLQLMSSNYQTVSLKELEENSDTVFVLKAKEETSSEVEEDPKEEEKSPIIADSKDNQTSKEDSVKETPSTDGSNDSSDEKKEEEKDIEIFDKEEKKQKEEPVKEEKPFLIYLLSIGAVVICGLFVYFSFFLKRKKNGSLKN